MSDLFNNEEDVELMIRQGRLRTAKSKYQKLLKSFPEHTVFLSFNDGCLHRTFIGDGVEARRLFQLAVRHRHEKQHLFLDERALDEMEANSIENLMLLSLSFEEFYSWADRLAQFQPDAPILTKWRAAVESIHEEGGSWSEVMTRQAAGYYDMDASHDRGMYGEALSTLQLLLQNRKQRAFQDSLIDYRDVVFDYVWVALSAYTKQSAILYQNFADSADPNEVHIILQTAKPLVEEFVSENPSDQQAAEKLHAIEKLLSFNKF